MTNDYTTGSYTVQGDVVGNFVALAAPTQAFGPGSPVTLDVTSGKRAIVYAISVPQAYDQGINAEAYRMAPGLYTTSLAGVVLVASEAKTNGLFRLQVFRGAGLTAVYTADDIAELPTHAALLLDADAGAFRVLTYDGSAWSELTLDADGYTPAAAISILVATEFAASDILDAGKIVSSTQITYANDMPPGLPGGYTDMCGNPLP